jgi:hypothetical protein
MTDIKHTPGPWFATPVKDKHSDDGPEFWLIDAVPAPNQETAVAEIIHKPGGRSEANARLIAAAPDTAAERDRLREALDGPGGPLDSRLEWLGCLLDEIDEGTFGRIGDDADPSATAEMVEEIRALYGETRALLSQPGGKSDG